MANQLDFRVKNGLIVGGNANIAGAITSVDSIQLDIAAAYTPPVEGQLRWHEDEGSVAVGLDNSIIADLPEVTLYRVTNNTGSTIPKGTLVASVGTTGNSGKILVAPWNPATQGPVQIMGITTGQILSGSDGHVTHFGKIRSIQTNGGNYGEVWVDGDILYAGPSGGLTKTVPTAPNTKTIVAIVISSHPSNGTLFVRPTLSSSIANDDLVQLSGTMANGDLLVWNSTNGRFENSQSINLAEIKENDYPVVTQSDIGTAPNEIPMNGYLGGLAYQNPEGLVIRPQASVTPAGIGDMTFQLTNNTTLVIKVKGSDGVVRSVALTLA